MEINEEAPLINCSIYSEMNRGKGVWIQFNWPKNILQLVIYDYGRSNGEKLSRNLFISLILSPLNKNGYFLK